MTFNALMTHLPKHWNAEEQRVCTWQPFLTSTAYPMKRLMGTYVFVSMTTEDIPHIQMGGDNPGFLKLGIRRGAPPEWENVYGYFQAANDFRRGAFTELVPHGSVSPTDPPRQNLYHFDLLTSYEKHVPLKGHGLDVLDVVDDNGNNYITMLLEYFVPGSNCSSYMGKKQIHDDDRVGLTEAERQKLGIGLTFEEVERQAVGARAADDRVLS